MVAADSRQRAGGTGKGRQTPLSRLWQNTQGPTEILFGTLPETCRAQTAQEVAELANKRIRELIGKIIEYESLVHAGECLDSECHNGKKDCTGRSCKRCRKRYYAKIKKQLIEKYSIKV